jgi:VanZ family protein
VVLGIGSLHHVPVPPTHLPIDKVGHFGMYGILGALTAYGYARSGRMSHLIVPIAIACSVGAIDEVHQRYVAGRSSDILDFAADVAGVSTGFWLMTRRAKAHNSSQNFGTE